MRPQRSTSYRIFIDLVFLVSIISVSAVLLARIWMHSVQPISAPVPTEATTPSFRLNEVVTPVTPSQWLEVASDFTLPALDGSSFSLSQFRGQPIVINFWASWCAPCRAEIPELVRIYERYREQGLVIVGVNVTTQDSEDNARAFVEEFGVTYPIVLDDTGTVSFDLYGVIGLPMSVFVNRQATVQRVVIGELTSETLDSYLAEILLEANPPVR